MLSGQRSKPLLFPSSVYIGQVHVLFTFFEILNSLLGRQCSTILVGFYLQKLSLKTNLQAMKERAQDQPFGVLGE